MASCGFTAILNIQHRALSGILKIYNDKSMIFMAQKFPWWLQSRVESRVLVGNPNFLFENNHFIRVLAFYNFLILVI